jgi:hypothetical protein
MPTVVLDGVWGICVKRMMECYDFRANNDDVGIQVEGL